MPITDEVSAAVLFDQRPLLGERLGRSFLLRKKRNLIALPLAKAVDLGVGDLRETKSDSNQFANCSTSVLS